MPLGSHSANPDQNIHEFIDAPAIDRSRVGEAVHDALRLRRPVMLTHAVVEFLHQQRQALGAPPTMAHRIIDLHALGGRAIPENNLQRLAELALVALVIYAPELP